MIPFTKMHGLGNDFLVVLEADVAGRDLTALAQQMCQRHTGVGADGLLVVCCEEDALRMRIFNADGSEAEMCGNGIRCFARYAWDKGLVQDVKFIVHTLAGDVCPGLILKEGEVTAVTVDMGVPQKERAAIPMTGKEADARLGRIDALGSSWELSSLRMGVPHTLIWIDDNLEQVDMAGLGAAIEKHEWFPQRTNVSFVQPVDVNTLRMRTWERGAGMTLACGTGACAAAVAAYDLGLVLEEVTVELVLGTLQVLLHANGHVRMTGPAAYVCEGTWLD